MKFSVLKFSMRVKLVSVLAVLFAMFAGPAQAVTITSIEVAPTLDSTGTRLTLEYTFYVNGVLFPHFEEIIGQPELDRLKLCNGVRTDIETSDKTLVCSVISANEEFYADRLVAEYTLATPLEPGNYLVRYMVMRDDPNSEENISDEEMAAIQAKYPALVERDPEFMYAHGEQPISIVRQGSGSDVSSVAAAITNYGLNAAASGSTITVTGSAEKLASDVLDLGDISGLVIDWKANITVTGGSRISKGIGMVNFTNGEFKLTGGTINIVAADRWVDAIKANGAATVTVAGGTVTSDRRQSTGFSIDEGTLIIDSGRINIPDGNAIFAKNLVINDASIINGFAITAKNGDINHWVAYMYGTPTAYDETEILPTARSDDLSTSRSYVVKSGATWTIDCTEPVYINLIDSITVEGGGALIIENLVFHNYGTLTNNGDWTNNGDLSNYSGDTIINNGTLTNNGTVSNAATGQITNTGTIDNSNGTIKNGGTITNTGSMTGNPVEPITASASESGGGGGGCNAGGIGILGLLLAGFVTHKYRKA